MKILLAVDGSEYSHAAVEDMTHCAFPHGTCVQVFSVAHAKVPRIPDPMMVGYALHDESLDQARERCEKVVAEVAEALAERTDLEITTKVVDGHPKHAVIDEAEGWPADLVIVGSHGRGAAGRFLLGSVSHAVALHAPCSVKIVRLPRENGDDED